MATVNKGKLFENDFKKSIPDYCYVHRLRDSAMSYNKNKNTSFAWDNECDFYLMDDLHRLFYAIECKSTKYPYMTVQINKDEDKKMISYHQIKSLNEMSKYNNIIAGFMFNFRHFEDDKDKYIETTYFQSVNDFIDMMNKLNKKSFNEIDLLTYGNAIKINGKKKITRFRWDIDEFLCSQFEKHN